jgi:hypothetical protein
MTSQAAARRVDELRAEVDYLRQRLDLYRARVYAGKSGNRARLHDYERAHAQAAERLSAAEREL